MVLVSGLVADGLLYLAAINWRGLEVLDKYFSEAHRVVLRVCWPSLVVGSAL